MKRVCNFCFKEVPYQFVKKYPHGLQVCTKCHEVIQNIAQDY